MPRNYKKKTAPKYDNEALETAINRVKSGETVYSVSKTSEVPYGTLYRRSYESLTREDHHIGGGRGRVLSDEEESLLVEALMYLSDNGFPQDRMDLRLMVKSYVQLAEIETPFNDGLPGKDWCISFERRWKESLGKRKPEILTKSRAADLSSETIRTFFTMYEETLVKNDLRDSPERIFNLDETGLRTDPLSGKAFVRQGRKTAYCVTPTGGKTMFTVLFCGSAAGSYMPPFVVYKAAHLYDSWCKGGPENGMFGVTASGWMEDYIFENWIEKFVEFTSHIKKPVLLLFDGHNSHLTYNAVKMAKDNQIILMCLPPNSSHALQPLDVGVFSPLKAIWKDILKQWFRETRLTAVSKAVFPTLLNKLVQRLKDTHLIGGFKGTGLFPVNEAKPMEKVVTSDENAAKTDESSQETVRNLTCAITSVISPPPSDSTKAAVLNSKRSRARVQAKKGEILTETDVLNRLQEESEKRRDNLNKISMENRQNRKRKQREEKNNNVASTTTTIEGTDQKYSKISIPGYGDCLFAAVAQSVFGSYAKNITDVVRKTAVEYICNHWPDFKECITVHDKYDAKSYSDYMSCSGVYGDNPEIAALSAVYGICIKVLVGPKNEEHGDSVYNREKMASGITILHYDPETKHYDLLKQSSVRSMQSQDKENINTENENKTLAIGDWVSVVYDRDGQWYPGEIVDIDNGDVERVRVKCMEVIGEGPGVKWQEWEDIRWYAKKRVLCQIQPPVPVSNRGFRLMQSDMHSILMNYDLHEL